ncbi:MAG: helix-turn-helix transcriptional regulator [Paenibacillaceae bacterium]
MNTNFGLYIKQKRKKRNMSLVDISTISGVSIAQISRVENGKRGVPRPETIKKLASALGIGYEDLMVQAGHLDKNIRTQRVEKS